MDMIAGVESAAWKLETEEVNDLRGRVGSILRKAELPPPNMTKSDREAINEPTREFGHCDLTSRQRERYRGDEPV